ncbi:hypothetical protein PS925_00845 [Pseudomonas fluorescens]|uniref:Uncharacterized protein n=1 Tax=Pseudomonas fluorescens TaxID=294 RepID=A0A5E7SGJ8_PSEFL|nr:hypothetical protein PS925_00845 [Pseudomonas fluorescens]
MTDFFWDYRDRYFFTRVPSTFLLKQPFASDKSFKTFDLCRAYAVLVLEFVRVRNLECVKLVPLLGN